MLSNDLALTSLTDQKLIAAAMESRRQLAGFLSTALQTQRIDLVSADNQRQTVEIPAFALHLLDDILGELAIGNSVKLVPIHPELTPQEAADLLNVSRPQLIKMLDAGVIAHTGTGRHRRIQFADLVAYKEQRDQASGSAMQALASQAQEHGMGY